MCATVGGILCDCGVWAGLHDTWPGAQYHPLHHTFFLTSYNPVLLYRAGTQQSWPPQPAPLHSSCSIFAYASCCYYRRDNTLLRPMRRSHWPLLWVVFTCFKLEACFKSKNADFVTCFEPTSFMARLVYLERYTSYDSYFGSLS